MQGETNTLKLVSGHENLFYMSVPTEGVLMSSQMFLHGCVSTLWDEGFGALSNSFCSALRAALFRLLALWFLLHSFPIQINQHNVWYNSSYYLLHQNYIEMNRHFTVFLLISLMYVAWICNAELIFEPIERPWIFK